LYEARNLLIERRTELDRQGLLDPTQSLPTTAQLIAKADALSAPILAVEALWDGDSRAGASTLSRLGADRAGTTGASMK
jgi:hypothetical protein